MCTWLLNACSIVICVEVSPVFSKCTKYPLDLLYHQDLSNSDISKDPSVFVITFGMLESWVLSSGVQSKTPTQKSLCSKWDLISVLLLLVFSACGKSMQVLPVYLKDWLVVSPPIQKCLTGLTGSSTRAGTIVLKPKDNLHLRNIQIPNWPIVKTQQKFDQWDC